ncbi:hypothetical protein OU798_07570 [Prolixibacteraceae bacterium Z1-6]|uniref:Uncharacterized protein n=1 Tax=Draconibacterium aestuarii TaxID=2998507 RepID=A0A9X3J670_9BACT|nr:hypothetical protein [Prolixibacteraceae bacterium Z1-6]
MTFPRSKKSNYELTRDVKTLENELKYLKRTIYREPHLLSIGKWPPPPPERHSSSIEARLDRLEDSISLIVDFLGVEVKNQPSKKLVKRKKKSKAKSES